MKLAAFCVLLNAFFVVAVSNTGIQHDGLGEPSHLSSGTPSPEAVRNTASNNDATVQLCILMAPGRLVLWICVLYFMSKSCMSAS